MAGATGGIVLSVLTGKGREEAEQTQGGIITKMFKPLVFLPFALITLSAAEQGLGGGKSKGKS